MDLLSQVMRLPYAKGLWARLPVGRVDLKVQYGIYPRPHYAYGVYWAAYLASCIGIPRITAIELGVAGGRGLVALEAACAEIGTFLGVKIDVVGFDAGEACRRQSTTATYPTSGTPDSTRWTKRRCEPSCNLPGW